MLAAVMHSHAEGYGTVLGGIRHDLLRRYLPIGGLKSFNDKSVKLAYGESASCIKDGRVAAVQSLSGTGSCRLFAEFMKRYMPGAAVYIPKPTWANHHNIFRDAQVEQKGFRYYKPDTRGLDFEGLIDDLQVSAVTRQCREFFKNSSAVVVEFRALGVVHVGSTR